MRPSRTSSTACSRPSSGPGSFCRSHLPGLIGAITLHMPQELASFFTRSQPPVFWFAAEAWCLALFGDQKIFFLRSPALGRCNHPARHPPTSRPRVPRFVAVLDGNFAARALAATAKKLVDIKPMLLRKSENLFPHCGAF